jgi:hypothetical protein
MFIALLSGVTGACGPIVRGTVAPGSESLPGPGSFHVEGDPLIAARTMTFRSVGPDGVPSGVTDTIRSGERIVVDRTTLPGLRTLTVDGAPCSGMFDIVAGREVDLVVRLTAFSCSVSVGLVHELGAVTH